MEDNVVVTHRLHQRSTGSRTMSAEMRDTAEETIIDFISCPICRDFIQPPSSCCENGHFMCLKCRKKIESCPICKSSLFPNIRNIVFDSILREIYYPCNNQENGCSSYFKYCELQVHQRLCEYQLVKCGFESAGCKQLVKQIEKSKHENICPYGVSCRIFSDYNGKNREECDWRGFKDELRDHVRKVHEKTLKPHCLALGTSFAWLLPMMIDFEQVTLLDLKEINEIFYFYVKGSASALQYISVQHVGNPEKHSDFMFSIDFMYDSKKVRFENIVTPHNLTKEEVYNSGSCFQVHYEFLKNHFMAERVIDCYVTIYKKDNRNEEKSSEKDAKEKRSRMFVKNSKFHFRTLSKDRAESISD